MGNYRSFLLAEANRPLLNITWKTKIFISHDSSSILAIHLIYRVVRVHWQCERKLCKDPSKSNAICFQSQ